MHVFNKKIFFYNVLLLYNSFGNRENTNINSQKNCNRPNKKTFGDGEGGPLAFLTPHFRVLYPVLDLDPLILVG